MYDLCKGTFAFSIGLIFWMFLAIDGLLNFVEGFIWIKDGCKLIYPALSIKKNKYPQTRNTFNNPYFPKKSSYR